MTARGKIRNGKVVLEDPNALPEGTEVEVRPAKKRQPTAKPKSELNHRLHRLFGKRDWQTGKTVHSELDIPETKTSFNLCNL